MKQLLCAALALMVCWMPQALAAKETKPALPVLLPAPRQIEIREGTFALPKGGTVALCPQVDSAFYRLAQNVKDYLKNDGNTWDLRGVSKGALGDYAIALAVLPEDCPHEQGYVLDITPTHFSVVAHDAAGVYYALQTVIQLARQTANGLPCVKVTDWPDLLNRGIMLDVSRNKVPTMDTLYRMVDLFAEMKLNQVQLYTEHTFAYKGHEEAWKNYSPMTPEQIMDLDAYCRDRFIELVPNQNSFAHLGVWLGHERYKSLAENPAAPSTLNPVDPQSVEFLRGLYADMLPNFSSKYFNVGCDETELGKAKSKEACEKAGVARVYFDFLMKVNDLVKSNNRSMQFWADIIFNHPDLIPELPKDVTAMIWGYEAGHPYADQTLRMKEAGVPFYVCPGTSAWNSLIGRTDNMMGNMRNAADNAIRNGARGLLVTDWGDGGHWQYLPVSYAGYAYAAALSWANDTNREADLARALDAHVFLDSAGVMGRFALDLGNVYKDYGKLYGNNTLASIALQGFWRSANDKEFDGLKIKPLKKSVKEIEALLPVLDKAQMHRDDAALVAAEFKNNAAMAMHGLRLMMARLDAKGATVTHLPANEREALAADLEKIIAEHRRLWLARNREGGLQDSAGNFENLLRAYRAQ